MSYEWTIYYPVRLGDEFVVRCTVISGPLTMEMAAEEVRQSCWEGFRAMITDRREEAAAAQPYQGEIEILAAVRADATKDELERARQFWMSLAPPGSTEES